VEWKILQLANSNISKQFANAINSGSLTTNLTTGYGASHGASPTISIGGGGGGFLSGGFSAQSINLGNLEFEFNDDVKKYEVYEISQDLLALSVCWARYRKVKDDHKVRPTITKLLDSDLFRLVSEDDITQATVIRDYYSKKIMVLKLKNEGFTSFREDLNTFVHSDGKMFKENMLPLAYRLPEFYEYDVEFEKMSFDYNREIKRIDDPHTLTVKQLKFIKKLSVNTRHNKRKEYWFSDGYNNLVNVNIENSNPLLSLLDMTVDKTDIKIKGNFKKSSRDGLEYLKVDRKFSFV
jgi:hypothetical protein